MLSMTSRRVKKATQVLGLLVAASAIYYISARLTIVHRAAAQVKAVPFTLELHSYSYTNDPAGTLLAKRVVARRADGTTISVHSIGPPEKGWSSRKIQYMDGRYTGIVDLISSVLYGSLRSTELAQLKSRLTAAPANCVLDYSFQFAGYEQLFGRNVARVVRERPQEKFTLWRDPGLGCETLQSSVQLLQADGTWKLQARLVPVALIPGEPDEKLLKEPASYSTALTVKELESRFSAAVEGR